MAIKTAVWKNDSEIAKRLNDSSMSFRIVLGAIQYRNMLDYPARNRRNPWISRIREDMLSPDKLYTEINVISKVPRSGVRKPGRPIGL
jgi:hypothetical protein